MNAPGRAQHESIVRLGTRPPVTSRGALAIFACWTLLVVGVLLIPAVCLFGAVLTAEPFESSGPPPPPSTESIALVWTARILATGSAFGVMAISAVVTARGGRLVNGWIALMLSVPAVALLWALRFG